ncbi:MAG: TIM44-like domain-containing protein [Rhodospirillales bacterium]|nr:TIM44-like domain-containing protein [Rhodospirillales bacterium]
MSKVRLAVAALGVASALAIVAADYAEARAGRGGSFGSRGGRTFSAPPATNTAPKVAPVEKSITQPGKATTNAQGAQTAAPAAQASRFGGMRGLLMGGLIAAGLASIFGVGALASILGFMLQFALIAGIAWLVISLLRNRMQPRRPRRRERPGAPMPRDSMMRETVDRGSAVPSVGGGAAAAAGAAALAIGQDDLDTFEKRLSEIQSAYSEENLDKLGDLTTPEMLSYFAQDLSDNAKEGVRNEISDVKLLKGDIAESWRENGSDYATVAMRYALTDTIVNKATGQIVSGDRTRPSEVTEVWTFRREGRNARDGWQLSAIQQA